MTDLKNRGVKDILIASVDGLNGFDNAILSIFPQAQIQRCIVHQIRNTIKYVSYKDRKSFAYDLKSIYTAPSEEARLIALNTIKDSWKLKYPYALRSWKVNWMKPLDILNMKGLIRQKTLEMDITRRK